MPSTLHEALIEMFRHRPSLAADLLTDALGLSLPEYQQVRLESGELTDLAPTAYRADAVVALTLADTAVLAVVVEVQLGRDRDKQWTWPVYLSTLRARLRCPTVLLVVCVESLTATWCARPIELGQPGWTLLPLVLGPDRVPVVTDADLARREPELAVLSAMAHGADADGTLVLDAVLSAFAAVDQERATLYSDVVLAALPAAAQRYLEAVMTTKTYEYQSDFVRRFVFQGRAEGREEGLEEGRDEGRDEGRAQGEAIAVLAVLDARGVPVPDDVRARITECADLDQLDTWIRRAATADTIDALFLD